MQNDIVKQSEKPQPEAPVAGVGSNPSDVRVKTETAVSAPASPENKIVNDIVPQDSSHKPAKPEGEKPAEKSDDIQVDEVKVKTPKKQKSGGPVLVVTFAVIVCLALVGLAVYSQMATK